MGVLMTDIVCVVAVWGSNNRCSDGKAGEGCLDRAGLYCGLGGWGLCAGVDHCRVLTAAVCVKPDLTE